MPRKNTLCCFAAILIDHKAHKKTSHCTIRLAFPICFNSSPHIERSTFFRKLNSSGWARNVKWEWNSIVSRSLWICGKIDLVLQIVFNYWIRKHWHQFCSTFYVDFFLWLQGKELPHETHQKKCNDLNWWEIATECSKKEIPMLWITCMSHKLLYWYPKFALFELWLLYICNQWFSSTNFKISKTQCKWKYQICTILIQKLCESLTILEISIAQVFYVHS